MKLIFAVICVAGVLSAETVSAKRRPKVETGVKAGINLQQMSSGGTIATFNNTYKPGLVGGVFLGVDRKKSGFRGEALIKTGRFDVHNSSVKLKTVTADIPILYEHKIVKKVWFQVGPQFSMLIKAKESNGLDFKNSMRNTDVSLVGGLHVILSQRLSADGRYMKGLVNINNSAYAGKWHNKAFQFTLGYRFMN